MARNYLITVAAIILLLVFGIFFNSNTTTTAAIAQQQQLNGTIKGMGTSETPLRVCGTSSTKDFLTVNFDAKFLLSSDEKTGKVTSGTGILKTTDSGAFVYLSITGGDINIGVEPKLYTLKGTATFQSPSSCNPPSAVAFSISKPDGAQLKCGNSEIITFNSISLTGSVTGNVNCIIDIIDTTPPTVTDTTAHNPPTVTASPKGSTFNTSPISVILTSNEPSTTIYYTIDGSTPTISSSTKYTGPITISNEGTTTLKFFGVDTAGNKETVQTETYKIDTTTTAPPTVTDTTPPTINIPRPIIIKDATSPQGAAVTYTVSAMDAVDGFITSDCFPASGSTFKFGTTTVTCKATDSAGNVAIKTFTVTVQQQHTTTTNVPSSPSPQPQLPQQQQQLPRLSPTQPTVPVQPGESGQTAIAPPPPPSPQFPSSKQTIPVQPGEAGQTAIAPPPAPLHPQSPSSKQTIPVQPGEAGQTAIAPPPPPPPPPSPQLPSSKQTITSQPSHPTP